MTAPREKDLAAPVVRELERRGFRCWVDPDGSDYLDLIARRGDEIGLVELKLHDWKKLLGQAIRRRGWADWIVVVLPRGTLANRLLDAPTVDRGRRIGVWVVRDGAVEIRREASALWAAGETNPFPELRRQLVAMLDGLDAGTIPPGIRWNLAGSHGRLPGGRRSTRDGRLEEFEGPSSLG